MPKDIKEFSTLWLQKEIEAADSVLNSGSHEAAFGVLMVITRDLKRYVEHISKNAGNKGRGTSAKKAVTSAANGRKGGRPKGSKNKPKEV